MKNEFDGNELFWDSSGILVFVFNRLSPYLQIMESEVDGQALASIANHASLITHFTLAPFAKFIPLVPQSLATLLAGIHPQSIQIRVFANETVSNFHHLGSCLSSFHLTPPSCQFSLVSLIGLGSSSRLKTLNLAGVEDVSSDTLTPFFQAHSNVASPSRLVTVNLSNTSVSSLRTIAGSQLPSLQVLMLSGTRITGLDVDVLIPMLGSLMELDLSHTSIETLSHTFLAALRSSHSLLYLNMDGCPLRPNIIASLMELAGSSETLQTLILPGMVLGGDLDASEPRSVNASSSEHLTAPPLSSTTLNTTTDSVPPMPSHTLVEGRLAAIESSFADGLAGLAAYMDKSINALADRLPHPDGVSTAAPVAPGSLLVDATPTAKRTTTSDVGAAPSEDADTDYAAALEARLNALDSYISSAAHPSRPPVPLLPSRTSQQQPQSQLSDRNRRIEDLLATYSSKAR